MPQRAAPYKGKVYIIPWVHSIEHAGHSEAIQLIRKIPKNSTLVLEVTPKKLGNIWSVILKGQEFMPSSGNVALYDLALEAFKRNIVLFPAENKNVNRLRIEARKEVQKGELKSLKKVVSLDEVCEQTIFNEIRNQLEGKTGRRAVYVATGARHVLPLLERLQQSGIQAESLDYLFSHPSRVRESMREEMTMRGLVKQGKIDEAQKLFRKSITYDFPSLFNPSFRPIVKKLINHTEIQKERTAKKFEKRRRKLAQRKH